METLEQISIHEIMMKYKRLQFDYLTQYQDAVLKNNKKRDMYEKLDEFLHNFPYICLVTGFISGIVLYSSFTHLHPTTPEETKIVMVIDYVLFGFLIASLSAFIIFYAWATFPYREPIVMPDYISWNTEDNPIRKEYEHKFSEEFIKFLKQNNYNTVKLEELAKSEYTNIENIDHDFYNQKDKVEHIISLFNKGEYLK